MTKKTPDRGTPVVYQLKEAYSSSSTNLLNKTEESVALTIIERINPDICAIESQMLYIRKRIKTIAEVATKPGMINKAHELASKLIIEINGYRFECANCIRKNCKLRDPETILKNHNPGKRQWYHFGRKSQ